MPSVTFLPTHATFECAAGQTVFEVARLHGVAIQTSCVGRATCGLCRVKVVAGEEHLSLLNADERKHLGNVYFLTKERLSCQLRVMSGSVTIDVPPPRDKRP